MAKVVNVKKQAFVRRNVTLLPEDFQTIRDFGRRSGLDFSSALRFIVREWQRQEGLRRAAREAAFVLRQAAANPSNDAENRSVYAGAAEALEEELGVRELGG